MDPITQSGESRFRTLITPFEGGRARLLAHLLLSCVVFSAGNVAARSAVFRIDLGALVTVYVALEYPLLSGAVAVLVLGYLADLFSGESRGLTMGALSVVFVMVRLLVVRVTGARWLMITAVSVFATAIDLAAKLLLEAFVGPGLISIAAATPVLVVMLGCSLIFGYPCYWLFRFVDDRFRPREENIVYGTLVPRRWM